jgi:hypothetical protein
MALSNGGRLLRDCPVTVEGGAPGAVKVWPVADHPGWDGGGLRAVVINKHPWDAAAVSIRVDRGGWGAGKLLRLRAPGGIGATVGVAIANVTYGREGIDVSRGRGGARRRGELGQRAGGRAQGRGGVERGGRAPCEAGTWRPESSGGAADAPRALSSRRPLPSPSRPSRVR